MGLLLKDFPILADAGRKDLAARLALTAEEGAGGWLGGSLVHRSGQDRAE